MHEIPAACFRVVDGTSRQPGVNPPEGRVALQVTETEIVLSLDLNRYIPSKEMVSLGLVGLLMLGGGIWWLVSTWGQVPRMFLPILLIGLALLVLLGSIMALDMLRQGDRRFVRITHEGVFFSPLLPTVVKWSEIAALGPYTRTFLGSSFISLGFVPRDPEALFARIIEAHSNNAFFHVISKINVALYRRFSSTFLPLQISQMALVPSSVDEVVTLIQERFSAELRASPITIQEWQP